MLLRPQCRLLRNTCRRIVSQSGVQSDENIESRRQEDTAEDAEGEHSANGSVHEGEPVSVGAEALADSQRPVVTASSGSVVSQATDQTQARSTETGYSSNSVRVATESRATDIGINLWKQLKRVQIPEFSGEKKRYENWKAAFTACVDNAPATPEYKLLQLRQYLKGEALRVIEDLGHSAAAYTAATETVHGLEGRHASSGVRERKDSGRTYVGASTASSNAVSRSKSCGVCGNLHGPWACQVFKQMDATQRWAKAKKLELCYRCLRHGHQGRSCQRTRTCGIDGCEDNHHRLLHTSSQKQTTSRQPVAARAVVDTQAAADQSQSDRQEQCTMMATWKEQSRSQEVTVLRTVPVVLSHKDREIQVNAQLDDRSTRTYLNSSVAAELGLQGRTQQVTVSVLNGQQETFQTMHVECRLRSVDRRVDINIAAFTTDKVTGDIEVVDWNRK